MSRAKTLLITIAAGMAVGAALGMLYAPVKGKDARRKLKKLKRKLTNSADDVDDEREDLQELSDVLQKEVERINRRLENR